MEIIKRLMQKLKRRKVDTLTNAQEKKFESENDYYKWFFTENELWNKTEPNNDEKLRWEGILSFVEKIKIKNLSKLEILDLGCGRGWLTKLLSSHGQVMGVEPVTPVVMHANKIFPYLNIIAGTSETLLEKGLKNNFDLVVSSEVLEHIPDDKKANYVLNIFSLLKSNGSVIITTPRKEVQEEYCKEAGLSQPVEEWLTEMEVKSLFIKAGFLVEDIKRLKRTSSSGKTLDIYQVWYFIKNK